MGNDEKDFNVFQVPASKGKHKTINRSFIMYQDVVERLNNFYDSNSQYTKQVIFNELISEALERYGF